MDLSKVKLVVSDMDGTLLNSKGEISDLFFGLFHKLKKQNIHFCAASGRQYHSIVHKLAPIKDAIFIIAENGGIAKKKDEIFVLNSLSVEKIKTIIPILRTINDTHIVLCGKKSAYIETTNKHFTSILDEYYTVYKTVPDLTKIADTEDFLKIAVYHSKSSESNIYPAIKHLKKEYLIKISGKNWLDISDEKANKGNALREVQKRLNISKEKTLVFGDYHNDIEMLQEATFSFAMKNAHKDILKIASYSTESNDNFGVEKILSLLIESISKE